MGDSEERHDVPDEGRLPATPTAPEPSGDAVAHDVFSDGVPDDELAEDPSGADIERADVAASLDEPEASDNGGSSPVETTLAETTADDPSTAEAGGGTDSGDSESAAAAFDDAATPEGAPEGAETAAPTPEDSEPVDPEIAALQAALDAEDESAADGEPAEAAAPDADADGTSESLDDIASGTVAGEEAASEDSEGIAVPSDRAGVPIWPFLVYFALWIVFAALLVWQFMQTPAGTPVYELDLYGISVLVGLVLTVLGPIVAIAVWLAVWLSRPKGAREGLFSRSLIIGAVATLAGVMVWLVALGALDMLRLGRLY